MPRLRSAPGFTGTDDISEDVALTMSAGGRKPMLTVNRGFSQPADFEYDRKKAIIEEHERQNMLAAKKRLGGEIYNPRTAALSGAAQADTVDLSIPKMAAVKPAAGGGLKKGVYNSDDVRALQTSLKDVAAFLDDKTLDPGAVDSDFGGATEAAVKAFQKRFGLTETGVVDAGTMREIQSIQANMARGGTTGADTVDRLGETDILGETAVNRGTAPKTATTASQSIKVGSPQFTALLGARLSFDQIDGLLASGLIDEDIATALKAKPSDESRREQGMLRGALGFPES